MVVVIIVGFTGVQRLTTIVVLENAPIAVWDSVMNVMMIMDWNVLAVEKSGLRYSVHKMCTILKTSIGL